MLKCGGDKKPGQSIALVGKADAKMHVAPSRAIESVGSCDRNRNNTQPVQVANGAEVGKPKSTRRGVNFKYLQIEKSNQRK